MAEIDAMPENHVGIVICDCGGHISKMVDTGEMQKHFSRRNEISIIWHEDYPCSPDGQARIRKAIQENSLNRILIAGCAPRLVEKHFQKSLSAVGFPPDSIQIVNIREHAALPAVPGEHALTKAITLVEMGLARLVTSEPVVEQTATISRRAMIIGSGLDALTTALSLANQEIPIILLEVDAQLADKMPSLDVKTNELLLTRREEVLKHPGIEVHFNTHIKGVSGHPGDYQVQFQEGDNATNAVVGAIIVHNNARLKTPGSGQWLDRLKVKTQLEFEAELKLASESRSKLSLQNVVMILCSEESQLEHCSRICCNAGIRQAIRVKELNPEANVTVLFRDLYLGGLGEDYEADLIRARDTGVTFFRYRKDHRPIIGNTIDVLDSLTGEAVKLEYDRAVLSMPLIPDEYTQTLSVMLGLPLDESGFMAEPRIRLKPDRYIEPGIFVLGSAQLPADSMEALYQAYLVAARVRRFMDQETFTLQTPVASIDADLCTGCGNCPQVCPTHAIRLEKREGILSLSEVDGLKCIGCGNCVVVCPVKAIHLPGWDNIEIPAQISAALKPRQNGQLKVLALACDWSAYGAADMAGARQIPYAEEVLVMRMNCSARFDPYHILWAFLNGADGVFLGACPVGDCHYGTGNLYAKERVDRLKTELKAHGIDPRRLRLEYLTVDNGEKFANTINQFVNDLKSEIIRK